MAICVSSASVKSMDKQISRYQSNLSKTEIECFFSNFSQYLATSEDKRLLSLQRAAINELPNSGKYAEQYVILVEQQKYDIDLTTSSNRSSPKLVAVYIAGNSGSLDKVLNEINKKCKIREWKKK